MHNRIHLYVNRKHLTAWLMALCLLASSVVRITGYTGGSVGWGLILPVFATVLYGVIALVFGQEMFYKTAIPIWLFGLSVAVQTHSLLQGRLMLIVMAWICIAFACSVYTAASAGRIRPWVLLPAYLLVLAVIAYVHHKTGNLWQVLPDYLLILGLMVLLCALKVHTDDKYHPTWGDRADGRLIRSGSPIDRIGPYIMVNRTGANNLFSESVEVTEAERYVRKKRREGLTGFGLSHVIIAAYVRTVAKYPALNRFVAGQKVYSRGEDIVLSMTVKKEMTASSPDTIIKVHLNPRDTAEDVYRKFCTQLEAAKDTMSESGVDNTAGILTLIPGLVLKFVVWLLKTLDYLGLIPGFLLEISPFHGSAYFTSMGSLGIKPIYHHLYDFGTIPVFCAFGRKRRAEEIRDGQIVERKYVDLKFNLDERICDGYYYAGLIKHFVRILSHPEVLDEPPVTVEKDIP